MTFKTYDNYRDSNVEWIEKIPSHWEVKKVASLFHERNEKVSDRDFEPLSVTKNGVLRQLGTVAKTDNNDNRKKVLKNDFVINSRSDRKGSCGVSELDGSVSMICTVLFSENNNVYMRYYHHLFRSPIFSEEYYRWGKGIVDDLWSTRWDDFKRINIPLPPYSEQKLIANFVDEKCELIDEIIQKKQQQFESLQKYRQAIISESVTKGLHPDVPMKDSGIEWLGQVPTHWKIINVRNLLRKRHLEIQDGNHGELHPTSKDYVDEGIPFVMASNLKNGTVDFDNCKKIHKDVADNLRIGFSIPGDVLLTHKGTIGEVAMVPDNFNYPYIMLTPQVTYYRFKTKEIKNKFVLYYFQSFPFKEQLKYIAGIQSTRDYIGLIAQKDLFLLVPPVEEQEEIISYLENRTVLIDQLLEIIQTQIQRLQEYRQALITDAVTGKIDVRNYKEEVVQK